MEAAIAAEDLRANGNGPVDGVRGAAEEPLGDVDSVRETQIAVGRLLRYAVSQANIQVEEGFVDIIVPILQQPAARLTAKNVATLWKGYNKLAMLVYPATSESILVAEQIEEARRRRRFTWDPGGRFRVAGICRRQLRGMILLLCGILLLFVVSQAYGIYLGDILQDAERHNAAWESVSAQIRAVKQANAELSEGDPPLDELSDRRDTLELRVRATYATLDYISEPWRGFFSLPETADGKADSPEERVSRYIALEQGARSVLRVWNFYVLPLVLGLLGAVAFITRRLLASLANNSYTPNTVSRYLMRLALGALLGVVGGIILAPDQPSLQGFSLSLVTLAFLMGYSVEFAFSAFDALIERGRQAFQPESAIATKG